MPYERSGFFPTSSSSRRDAGRRWVRVGVLVWAALVYVAYWLRYLPRAR